LYWLEGCALHNELLFCAARSAAVARRGPRFAGPAAGIGHGLSETAPFGYHEALTMHVVRAKRGHWMDN